VQLKSPISVFAALHHCVIGAQRFETASGVECQLKNEDETNTLPRNIGHQSPGDAAKHSMSPETQAKRTLFLSQSMRFVGIHNIENKDVTLL
jgi:hypothetical protein